MCCFRFAQFEREVTGERIRDKIAASKRKGLWMGGVVPTGYAQHGRTLAIDETEAAIVRLIFQRYLELGSVRLLKADLDQRGILSRAYLRKDGKQWGGRPYSRGKLYKLLGNPTYVGQIRHKEESYPGQHPPIVERELWEHTQTLLRKHTIRRSPSVPDSVHVHRSALKGKLFDEAGESLTPTHTVKRASAIATTSHDGCFIMVPGESAAGACPRTKLRTR